MNFAIASKITSLFAATTGSGVSSVLLNDAIDNVVETTNSNAVWSVFLNYILNFLGEILLAVGKFALGFIDLIQFIVYKFIGVNLDSSSYNGYDPNNPIIRFLSNDTVLRVLRSMLAVAAVLVILFSIYAIIRGEYARAVNNSEYNAKRVVARALRSMFGMVIFPIVFLVIVILTNAVASSFARALSNDVSATIGGQVISTAAYGANNYRKYANNNQRVPIVINFDDPYNNKVALSRYTTEELAEVYTNFQARGRRYYNMFANSDYESFANSLQYTSNDNTKSLRNAKSYNEFENFVCTAEQYYVMADFMDYALQNGLTFYYKYIGSEDIDWKYVDSTVFDKANQTLRITYRDANKVYSLDASEKGDNATYTVDYVIKERELTSPIQDALTTLGTLLSLDKKDDETGNIIADSGEIFKTIEKVEGSINQIQWKTNKVRLKLSSDYDNEFWNATDKVLLYEFYRYQYNNSLGEYSIADLINGVDVDLYTVYPQFYRSYTGKYENLNVGNGNFDGELCVILNGNYYKVAIMYENGEVVVDDYGDPVYKIDVSGAPQTMFYSLDTYNATNGTELGVKIPNHGYCSTTYLADGSEAVTNPMKDLYVNVKGNEYTATVDGEETIKYGFPDINGIMREVDRVKAVKNTKSVSFPVKLTNDLQTIYRNLNLNQLVTTGEWLSAFSSNVDVVDGKYVASFDTSLITPQGLIFSEIFLGEIAESNDANLGNYIFKSKYTDNEIKALMLSLLGEEYYETVKTSINCFVDTFNLLFEPLLERIMAGENQQMKVGEIESIQLYTYKAYLASILLSSDSAQFFLNIAKSLIGMYLFNYNISVANPDQDMDEFVNNVILEYFQDDIYSADGENGKIKYMLNLETFDIDWTNYFDDEEESQTFSQYLQSKYDVAPSKESLPEDLVNAIYNVGYETYKTFAEFIIDEIAANKVVNGYRVDKVLIALKESGEDVITFDDVAALGYDSSSYTLSIDSRYHSYKQMEGYDDLEQAINNVSKAILLGSNESGTELAGYYSTIVNALDDKGWSSVIDDSQNLSGIITNYHNAVNILKRQGVTSESNGSWPQYLITMKKYVCGEIGRQGIILSNYVLEGGYTSYVNSYDSYVSKFENACNNIEEGLNPTVGLAGYFTNDIFDLSIDGVEIDKVDKSIHDLYINTETGLEISGGALFAYYFEFKGVSDDLNKYKAQIDNLSAYVSDLNEYIKSIEYDDAGEKRDFGENQTYYETIIATLKRYVQDVQSVFSSQKILDGLTKYFITLSNRMVTTEMVAKNFNVIVNNHSYELKLTMPTAMLTEYIVGGRYLSKIGFETAYVTNTSKGFLDIDYDEDLPEDGQAEFKTLNKFFNNLATITLQSYYMSNLQNMSSYANLNKAASTSLKDLDEVKLNAMYNFIKDNYGEALGITKSYAIENLNEALTNIIGAKEGTDYSQLTMKELRYEMRDSIINYQTSTGFTEEQDSIRFIALFNLFCSDFKVSTDGTSVVYETDVMTKSIVLRLAGIEDLSDENLINLSYQHVYDEVGYDENNGDYFIICTYDNNTGLYVPFLMTNLSEQDVNNGTNTSEYANEYVAWKDAYKFSTAVTTYYKAESRLDIENYNQNNTRVAFPIIAKGIVTDEGLPTAIKEVNGTIQYYRSNLVVRNTSELGLEQYFLNAEEMSQGLGFVATMVNNVTRWFTGKSLVERACEMIPRLSINANVSLPFGVDEFSRSLETNAVTMDYSFEGLGNVEIRYYYNVRDIDYFTLFIAIIALMPIMIKALFGVFGRVLDITLYYVMSPVMFSTLALGKDVTDNKGNNSEDSPYFTQWWDNIIKKTISVFSYIFAFQVFFILVPYIKENMNVFSDNTAFQNIPVFKNFSVTFINDVLKVILIICSAYLITEAPKIIADILGQEDGIAKGAEVQGNVKSMLNDVKNSVNGQKLVNTVNYAKESLKDVAGVNAIKDATGAIKKVGAKVVSKGAEYALKAKGVSKDQAKKITGSYYESIKKAEDNKKAIRDEKRISATSAYINQMGEDKGLKDKAESAQGKVSKLIPEDWKKQYKNRKNKK